MRQISKTLAIIIGAAAIALSSAAGFADGKLRVKLATLAPKGTSFHQILQDMGEQWRKASGDTVSVTIYADGVMGSEPEMVRRMRIGQLQAAMLTVAGLAEIDPSVKALQTMPMMFRSLDEVDYIREKLRPDLERKFAEKGFIVLFWGDAGWVRPFSNQPSVHPDDFKKLKLFTWAGDTNQIDIMKAAGYNPVPLEYTDILTGLQTGLIDAVPSAPFYALAGQFYVKASHMLEINWVPLVGGTVMTRKAWDTLSPEKQEALRRIAAITGEKIKQQSRKEMTESVKAMQQRGLQVHPATPEVEEEWRKAISVVYPKIRGNMVPAETFDEVQRLLEEFRARGGNPR